MTPLTGRNPSTRVSQGEGEPVRLAKAMTAESGGTWIVVVLDRSGSMEPIRDDAVGGFNAFVDEQRGQAGEARLMLVLFDSQYEIARELGPLAEVPRLAREDYVPRAGTALFDAMGRAIADVEARLALHRDRPPSRIVMLVITDGQENSSRAFTWQELRGLIDHRLSRGWTFLFLGTTEEAIRQAAEDLGLGSSHTLRFRATGAGIRVAFDAAATLATSARTLDSMAARDLAGLPDPKKSMN